MPNPIPIKKLEQAFKEVLKRLPAQVGAEVVNFSRRNFRMQGFQGERFTPWAKRRDNSRKGGAILVHKGRLRRSIRVLRATATHVVVGTDVPYARAHNEGFTGTVSVRAHVRNKYSHTRTGTGRYTKAGNERTRRVTTVSGGYSVKAHTRTMKIGRRQFIGDSPHLRRNIRNMIAIEVLRAAKRL